MTEKIVAPPLNFYAVNFDTNSLGTDYVKIHYKRKNIGNVLKMNINNIFKGNLIKTISLPKNAKILRIENNKPKISYVTITYNKY